MRNSINACLIVGLAVLAVSGAPIGVANAVAQADEPNDARKDEIASWPADKQASYNLWPAETKDYYWTLSPARQKLFWGLTDADKVTLSGMDEADKAKVWERLEKQDTAPGNSR
ncbi:MAG: hypothetical protein AAFO28_05010 [Pseudomonadota bacterium]